MQRCPASVLLLLGAMASVTGEQTGGTVTEGGHQVAVVVGQVVEQYLAGCHLVLAATTQHSLLLQHITRQLPDDVGSVVVEAESLFTQEEPAQEHLLQGLWGKAGHTCRALILLLTKDTLAFRFFEASGLWLWPETRVVLVGGGPDMEASLYHPGLRNTRHTLYLAVHLQEQRTLNTKLKKAVSKKAWSGKAVVYRRCLYCNNGEVDVQRLHQWNVVPGEQQSDDPFPERPEDFMGHKFEIVALPFFPISDFKRNSEALGTTFTPLDSIDLRMLNSFMAHANFTYEVREPWDGQWGVDPGTGNWTGSVGTLQQERADFCLVLTVNPTRIKVVEFTVPYFREPIVIFSLKPGLLPQHLAIIRPFTGMIWLLLAVSFLVWSVTLWLLQKALSLTADVHDMQLSSAFLYSWSVLMEKWTFDPPDNLTVRLLAGLWLLSCLIFTTAYRSSLVAHLIVQDKMPEINSFQELLARDGWGWGTSFSSGSLFSFFKTHPYSDIQEIYQHMQFAPAEEQFERVIRGSYSHITYKNIGLAIVATSFTDSRGYTPLHISRSEHVQYVGKGWGFRKGAPFLDRFSRMIQHLVEGGFIDYWLQDIFASHTMKAKEKRENGEERGKKDDEFFEVTDGNVSLGLEHLQGAFFLLLMGCGVAALTLLGENLPHYCNSRHRTGLLRKNLAHHYT